MELDTALKPITICALAAGDVDTVAAVFAGLSPDSRYLRFGGPQPRLTPRALARLADVHSGRHEAHVAYLDDRPVGLIRWIRYAGCPDRADLAVEVIDTHRRRAIGWRLLAAAAQSAAAAGIRVFVPYVLDDNHVVQHWAKLLGATRGPTRGDLCLPIDALLERLAERASQLTPVSGGPGPGRRDDRRREAA